MRTIRLIYSVTLRPFFERAMRPFICTGLLTFVGFSVHADILNIQTSGLPPTTYGGYYVGPVRGTDNGLGPIDLWCDDFLHETSVPTNYSANLSTIPSLTNARFNPDGDGDALQDYEQIAWLIGEYYQMSASDKANNQKVGDLQFAIWLIFNPTQTSLQTTGALAWLTTVNNVNLNAYNYSGVRIFTPETTTQCGSNPCAPGNQEFITGTPAVPEPASIVLLASGAFLAMLAIRRRDSKGYAAEKPTGRNAQG